VLTRDDFTVEVHDGTYGPIWVITPNSSPDRHYVLRSTAKMYDGPDAKLKGNASIHIDVTFGDDPLRHAGGWKGVYRTRDMDVAFTALIDDLNRNKKLAEIYEAISEPVSEMLENLRQVDEAVEPFARYDIDEVMENISLSYEALILKFREVNDADS